jgi:hypothetical protein
VILITLTTSYIKFLLLCLQILCCCTSITLLLLQLLWNVNLLVLEEAGHRLTVLGKQLTYFQIIYLSNIGQAMRTKSKAKAKAKVLPPVPNLLTSWLTKGKSSNSMAGTPSLKTKAT